MKKSLQVWLPIFLLCLAVGANAQSFRVQCPTSTLTHPDPTNSGVNNVESPYTAVTYPTPANPPSTPTDYTTGKTGPTNGAIKCQQVSGGDGYATMADGTQTFMFSFGPLSGLADIAAGGAGTEFPSVFNTLYPGLLKPGDPATTDGAAAYSGGWGSGGAPEYAIGSPTFTWNGAVGLMNDVAYVDTIFDISESGNTVTVVLNTLNNFNVGDKVKITGTGAAYDGTWTVSAVTIANPYFAANFAFQYTNSTAGLADVNQPTSATAASLPQVDGHVDPRQIMDVGVMNGNIPAPLVAFDEDDELFLTLTNVGMIMRPDLFEQHTIHFHGYPNASSFYDGVPDASVAINIGGSFTYYYLAPDAGTYFWHCHITPPEHLQMGMVGQLYVRPRQDRAVSGTSLYNVLMTQQGDLRTACRRPGDGLIPAVTVAPDILCSTMLPATNTGAAQGATRPGTTLPYSTYTYNDGDGSTAYDEEYPLQIHGFDPNFHFVGMTFNPEGFVDMKDKYFLLNGRSYPDTVAPGPQMTQSSDGRVHYSQPLPAIINIPQGGRALLRIADLSVSEYATLQSMSIPMKVVGYNAKLLRDQAGNNTEYFTNSITLGGGESLDVVLDVSDASCGSTGCSTTLYPAGSVFYLYTPQLDHLSNDAENFGGLMTEVHICKSVSGGNTFGNTCN